MSTFQTGILADLPQQAIFIEFTLKPNGDAQAVLDDLSLLDVDEKIVFGLGQGLISAVGKTIDGLRAFPALSGPGCEVPTTQASLWCWLRGSDRGKLFHQARQIALGFEKQLRISKITNCYKYSNGLDLSGYEDGTENPTEDAAVKAAIVSPSMGDLAGSSFVAVQNWLHDFDVLDDLPIAETDDIIGRRKLDNEEFEEAPVSAHVKRTAQETFDPEAFVVRRSMPWSEGLEGGFMFIAFGATLNSYEAQLKRMAGLEDGIVDGLFKFTTPISGSYFWCPPVNEQGHLDLTALK